MQMGAGPQGGGCGIMGGAMASVKVLEVMVGMRGVCRPVGSRWGVVECAMVGACNKMVGRGGRGSRDGHDGADEDDEKWRQREGCAWGCVHVCVVQTAVQREGAEVGTGHLGKQQAGARTNTGPQCPSWRQVHRRLGLSEPVTARRACAPAGVGSGVPKGNRNGRQR